MNYFVGRRARDRGQSALERPRRPELIRARHVGFDRKSYKRGEAHKARILSNDPCVDPINIILQTVG